MRFDDVPWRHRASTAAVLEFAWDAGVVRADHVMAACGLTRSTTLSALDALIEIGLIRERINPVAVGSRLGRPARHFELRGEAGLVIGIDAGNRHFTTVAADLAGTIEAKVKIPVPGLYDEFGVPRKNAHPKERRHVASQAIDEVLAKAGRTRDDVIAVGVGIPSPVDGKGMSPSHPSGFWQHMNADLQASLAKDFPAVRVENDGALAALAEGTVGEARGSEHFVAMLTGHRFGSGVFLEGRLVRGAHGGVGELEALRYVADIGGTHGLGDLAEKWGRAALDEGRVPEDHPWSQLAADELSAEALLAHADLSDPVSRPLLEELGAKLSLICGVVARFYDPEKIVVCGAMAGALAEVIEIAQERIVGYAELPAPGIVASTLGGDVVSLGAVSAAREAAREIVLPLFAERQVALGEISELGKRSRG